MQPPSVKDPVAVFAEAQRQFVDYYASLAEEQQRDLGAQGEELPNYLIALQTALARHWWRDLGIILFALDNALVDAGHATAYRHWLEAALQAEEIAQSPPSRQLYLALLDSYATVVQMLGASETAIAVYHRILALVERGGASDDELLANTYFGLGTTYLLRHQSSEAHLAWEKAAALARQVGDPVIPALIEYLQSASQGSNIADVAFPETAKKPAGTLRLWWRYVADHLRAYKLIRAGRHEEAQSAYRDLVAQAQVLHDQQGLALALFLLGEIAAVNDQDDRAFQLLRRSEAIAARMNDHIGLALIYSSMGLMNLKQGRFDRGRPYLEESVRLEREHGGTQALADALFWLGYARANTGDLAGGEACFLEARALFAAHRPGRLPDVDEVLGRLRIAMDATHP